MGIQARVLVSFTTGKAGSKTDVRIRMDWEYPVMGKETPIDKWSEIRGRPTGYLGKHGGGEFRSVNGDTRFFDEDEYPYDEQSVAAFVLNKFPKDPQNQNIKGKTGDGTIYKGPNPMWQCTWTVESP